MILLFTDLSLSNSVILDKVLIGPTILFENIGLIILLGLTSVGLFNSFVYISLNYTPKKSNKINSSWNFAIYNIYNKKNPFFMYYDFENNGANNGPGNILEGNLDPKLIQVSLFPILPSITWNFKF